MCKHLLAGFKGKIMPQEHVMLALCVRAATAKAELSIAQQYDSSLTCGSAMLQVVQHFLASFETRARPQEQLVLAVRHIVLPLLEASFKQGQTVLDEAMVKAMVVHMFDPPDEQAGARFAALPGASCRLHTTLCLHSRSEARVCST